ncbi:MAG: NAD(P)H-binding protein [Firmicutes bacterium]|nr:NAD(P)H-binding protein [Bacillota bacterium]
MYVVTGATGFIGAAVVRHLLSRGILVRALARESSRLPGDLRANQGPGRLEIVEADLLRLDRLREVLSGARRVIHCAGLAPAGPAPFQMPAHGAATHNLLLTCRAVDVDKVVIVSTLAAALNPAPDAHSAAKAEQEQAASEFRRHGLNVTIIRSAPVFGPGGDSLVNRFAQAVAAGGFYRGKLRGEPDRLISCTYVSDLAKLLDKAAGSATAGGVYPFASETLRLSELAARIERLARELGIARGLWAWPARFFGLRAPRLPVEWRKGLTVSEATIPGLDLVPADPEEAWRDTVQWLAGQAPARGGWRC